jgi:hypothetical protein
MKIASRKTLINLSLVAVIVGLSFPLVDAGASSKQNPIPITLPAKPVGVITFTNIEEHISEIPSAAYSALQSVYSANS